MITKILYGVVLLFCIQPMYGQYWGKNVFSGGNTLYDVETNMPICAIRHMDDQGHCSVDYIYGSDTLNVSGCLKFAKDIDDYYLYMTEMFFSVWPYGTYLYEYNAYGWFVALFNSHLKMVDVRIVKRGAYDNKRCNIDSIVKKAIRITEADYVKIDSQAMLDWYIAIGKFRVP